MSPDLTRLTQYIQKWGKDHPVIPQNRGKIANKVLQNPLRLLIKTE